MKIHLLGLINIQELVQWCLTPLSTIFSAILLRSALLVEETRENMWQVPDTLYHIIHNRHDRDTKSHF